MSYIFITALLFNGTQQMARADPQQRLYCSNLNSKHSYMDDLLFASEKACFQQFCVTLSEHESKIRNKDKSLKTLKSPIGRA
jgi:hypothetical protein